LVFHLVALSVDQMVVMMDLSVAGMVEMMVELLDDPMVDD